MTSPSHNDVGTTLRVGTADHRGRTATLLALTLAASAETWTTSGVSLTLTDLTGTLSASADEASWALTVYMTSFSVSVALSHRLSLRYGNRRYLAFCAGLYALASVGCMLSPNLSIFLTFRAIAGFAGGVFLVRAFVFFTQQFDMASRIKPTVTFAIVYFLLGRVVSPMACGWLADVASWRYIFLPETLVMLIAAWTFHRHTADHWVTEPTREPIDTLGIALLIVGAVFVQAALSRGEIDGWFESSTLVVCLVVGLAGNILFAVWQLSSKNRYPHPRCGLSAEPIRARRGGAWFRYRDLAGGKSLRGPSVSEKP